MQFPAFPGPELVNREGFQFKALKNAQKNEIFDWFGNYNYQFAVIRFLVDSKTDSNRKECTNPISLEIVFIRSKG